AALHRAEAEHHAAFALVDRIEPEEAVGDQRNHQDQTEQARVEAARAAAAGAAAEQPRQLSLQLLERFVQIGRTLITAVAPGILAPAGLVPSHLIALHRLLSTESFCSIARARADRKF